MPGSKNEETAAVMKELARTAGDLHAAAGEQVLGGRWRLVREIGSGGFGTVWRAEHLVLHGPVAIKILGKEIANDPGMLARFLREARAAASIRHRGIVEVRDVGQSDDGRPYLVMELMDGPTLRSLLNEGRPPPSDRVRGWMTTAGGALAAAHAAGVIHRDIKPDNLLLTAEDGDVKVSDFGLCIFKEQEHNRITADGRVYGSVQYVAPERIKGEDPTPKSDVYSFGATLFELLTGQPLWPGEVNPAKVCRCHLLETPPVASVFAAANGLGPIPDDLDDLVTRCVEKEPEDRPSMEEVYTVLLGKGAAATEEFLPAAGGTPIHLHDTEPSMSDGSTVISQIKPQASSSRVGAALLVAAGLALLIAAIVLLL